MKTEVPLYFNVAYAILFKILTREYKKGDALPNRYELSQIYHVSEITIRRALQMLVEEKCIEMQRGKRPVISIDIDNPEVGKRLHLRIVKWKNTMIDILNSYRFILPPFMNLGMSKMNEDELTEMLKSMDKQREWDTHDFYITSNTMIQHIIEKTNNKTIIYYFKQTQFILLLTIYVSEIGELIRQRQSFFKHFYEGVEFFLNNNQETVVAHTVFDKGMNRYLDTIINGLNTTVMGEESGYAVHSIFKDYEPKYLSISYDIMKKIQSAQYVYGEFLPSEALAALEYEVAPLTTRKAYRVLKEAGYVESIPSIGTRVVYGGKRSYPLPYETMDKKKRSRAYADCIYFLKMIMKNVVNYAIQQADDTHFQPLVQKREHFKALNDHRKIYYLVDIMDCIVEATHCKTFLEYYRISRPLVFFGSYVIRNDFYIECEKVFNQCCQAVEYLEQHDLQKFAEYYMKAFDFASNICLESNEALNR